jgi:hypothetical protein
MSGIKASSQVIIDLGRNIYANIRNVFNSSINLNNQLKTLGHTFQDEGFIRIQNYIKATEKQILGVEPELRMVETKLIEYAELIIKSGGTL